MPHVEGYTQSQSWAGLNWLNGQTVCKEVRQWDSRKGKTNDSYMSCFTMKMKIIYDLIRLKEGNGEWQLTILSVCYMLRKEFYLHNFQHSTLARCPSPLGQRQASRGCVVLHSRDMKINFLNTFLVWLAKYRVTDLCSLLSSLFLRPLQRACNFVN